MYLYRSAMHLISLNMTSGISHLVHTTTKQNIFILSIFTLMSRGLFFIH